MCFGGSKQPTIQQAPEVAPPPSPTPSETSQLNEADNRRKRLQQYRAGLPSTIKTSPRGTAGAGVNLEQQTIIGKQKLGE